MIRENIEIHSENKDIILITMEPANRPRDLSTKSLQFEPAPSHTGTRPGTTPCIEPILESAGSLQSDSRLHSEDRPESFLRQEIISPSELAGFKHLHFHITLGVHEKQFVDVQLFGEWTEGYLIEASDEYASVLIANPYDPDDTLQQLPIENIAPFRSKTKRSSLTSHLETSLESYVRLEYQDMLSQGLFTQTYHLSQEQFLQFFAGVLPLGCSALKHVYPLDWKGKMINLVSPALIAFYRYVLSFPENEAVGRAWQSVFAAERIVLETLSESSSVPEELVIIHLETIASTTCPAYITKTFKDLKPYCAPYYQQRLNIQSLGLSAAQSGEGRSYFPVTLVGNNVQLYGKAGLTYLDFCIRLLDWPEALDALVSVLIANARSQYPILEKTNLISLLKQFAIFTSDDSSKHELKSTVLQLLFSVPYPAGGVTPNDLISWSLVDSESIEHFLLKASGAACVFFLERNLYSLSPLRTRVMDVLSETVISTLVFRASFEGKIVELGFALRGNRMLCRLRKSEGLPRFFMVQRHLVMWIWEKTKRLQTIPKALMQEAAKYI